MRDILIVEDEKYMLDLLIIHLRYEYNVYSAKDGAEALELIKKRHFDLIILDIMLPYVDGWTICEEIRKKHKTPILMLTARTELSDKVKGFEIGADDYLVKPFEFEELKARMKALFRRTDQIKNSHTLKENSISFSNGLFRMHLSSRKLYINNTLVELTTKEFDLLFILANSPNHIFTRDILLNQIWENHEDRDVRIVDTHIKNIRTKIKNVLREAKFINTIWGIGYQFTVPGDQM
ncbi:transcriptional regulator [Ureibacillus massiliensis 4400831 = CIP 108448 = CCUG 49529]|uniref:Transcriptional regulator n=1 Tax=Ureibacillus massiliensis 4400831 = CIP 108448 = CCUG 49529 TaxID=1211035 RepID=A0A0A3IYD8_9BACL|nr:response regulator transcription factor [Ureibacillus massiliensis]KGR89726.1 transcriptional regulator [Ureibacillus massiliensis 4400831 = CIP 108448 = CCUG 49529]